MKYDAIVIGSAGWGSAFFRLATSVAVALMERPSCGSASILDAPDEDHGHRAQVAYNARHARAGIRASGVTPICSDCRSEKYVVHRFRRERKQVKGLQTCICTADRRNS